MASTSKCPYCGAAVSSSDEHCPNCGAPNEGYVINTPRTVFLPKTIDELKEYCAERGMPLLKMRFFVGEDFKEPRAFGIYQDGDEFVVYKNKANGERSIRYRGPDEEYAVSELFAKLLEECHNRGIYPDGKPESGGGSRSTGGGEPKKRNPYGTMIVFFGMFFILFGILVGREIYTHSNDAYYCYEDTYYYHHGNDWYYSHDGDSNWYETNSFPADNYEDYYVGEDYDSDWGVTNFKSSETYQEIVENNSSSSSDYDSWDSSDTDWDSDW